MITKILNHLRGNAIAYVALFFAVGGGGAGAAIAATVTSSSTIHACVSKKNGAVYIAKKCSKTTKALVFNEKGPAGATGATGAPGPTGTSAVVAYGQVADNGAVGITNGMTITPVSTGVYDVTITASACAGESTNTPVVSPNGGPSAAGSLSGIPTAWIQPSQTPGVSFVVQAGDIQGGSFVNTTEGFDLQDQCGGA